MEIIAARIANRELERQSLGDGFHARVRAVRNRKRYTRKSKHKNADSE
ncbi:MAG: hypothetical protein II793_06710 [Bacteroidales bacterium]|nr:hypothetical protein [Bacteroidales bacterium]